MQPEFKEGDDPGFTLGQMLNVLSTKFSRPGNNPPFHRMITTALRDAGVDPPAGPPFTTLQDTLAEIGTGPPSWTVFYHREELPVVRRVALRPIEGLTVLSSLAVPPGVPSAQVRALLRACARVAEAR